MRAMGRLSPEVLLALALVVVGALACFAGFRLIKVFIIVLGAVAGAMVGFGIGQELSGRVVAVVLAVIVGAAGGVLLYAFAVMGFFVFGGALLVGIALGVLPIAAPAGRMIAGIIAFIVGGVLALVLTKFVLIVGTSFEGAALVVLGAARMVCSTPLASLLRSASSGALFEALADRRPWAFAVAAAFVVLFAAGIYVQFSCGADKGAST